MQIVQRSKPRVSAGPTYLACACLARSAAPLPAPLQDELQVRKLLLRDRLWDALAALAARDARASRTGGDGAEDMCSKAAAATFAEAEPGLSELEAGFAHDHSEWFKGDGSAGGDRGGSGSGGGGGGDEVRNWRPVEEGSCGDLPALAGQREKEALRVLGFGLMLRGREIGVDGHGLLPNGMLTREALACLGLGECQGYDALWRGGGLVATAAAGRAVEEVLRAAAELREAEKWRRKDDDRRCKLRRAVRSRARGRDAPSK